MIGSTRRYTKGMALSKSPDICRPSFVAISCSASFSSGNCWNLTSFRINPSNHVCVLYFLWVSPTEGTRAASNNCAPRRFSLSSCDCPIASCHAGQSLTPWYARSTTHPSTQDSPHGHLPTCSRGDRRSPCASLQLQTRALNFRLCSARHSSASSSFRQQPSFLQSQKKPWGPHSPRQKGDAWVTMVSLALRSSHDKVPFCDSSTQLESAMGPLRNVEPLWLARAATTDN